MPVWLEVTSVSEQWKLVKPPAFSQKLTYHIFKLINSKNDYKSPVPNVPQLKKLPYTKKQFPIFLVFKTHNSCLQDSLPHPGTPLVAIDLTNPPTSIYYAPLCAQNSVGAKKDNRRKYDRCPQGTA